MAKGYTTQEADDFLDKVTELQSQVKGIIDGSIPIEEIDEKIKMTDKIKEIKEREAKEAEEKKLKLGRKGKGHKGNYKRF